MSFTKLFSFLILFLLLVTLSCKRKSPLRKTSLDGNNALTSCNYQIYDITMQFYVQFTQCNDKIITEKIAVPYGNFSIKSKLDARYYNDIPIRTIETDSLGQAKVSLISGTYGVFNEIKLNQAFIKSYLYRLKEIKDPHRKFDESCFKKYTTTPDQVIVVNGNKHFDIIMELPCDSPHYPCFVPKK